MITPDDIFKSYRDISIRSKSKRAAYTTYTPRRADKNQPALVKAFRQLGAKVAHIHMVGEGVWDIIVAVAWVTAIIEIKNGDMPPSKRAFTPNEKIWGMAWPGLKGVACNSHDVEKIVSAMRYISGTCGIRNTNIGNQESQYIL